VGDCIFCGLEFHVLIVDVRNDERQVLLTAWPA
jgi:hypothetical protein